MDECKPLLCGRVMALADMYFGQMAAEEAATAIGDGSGGGDDGEGDEGMGMMRGAEEGDGEQILPGWAWQVCSPRHRMPSGRHARQVTGRRDTHFGSSFHELNSIL